MATTITSGPRDNYRRASGSMPIPRNMNEVSWKVIITDSSGNNHDVTNYMISGNINFLCTDGVSSFNILLDNNNGRYVSMFNNGNIIDIYYNYSDKSSLSKIRFRGLIDNIFDNFNMSSGFTISIEGRNAPKSSYKKHFVDTHITKQFTNRNILDAWLGTSGSQDTEGNYEDGILYQYGLILKVYDNYENVWRIYKDLSDGEKTTLKSKDNFDSTITTNYENKSPLTASKDMATKGDYDFYIDYDESTDNYYLIVMPESSYVNELEQVSIGQNLINISRYGKETLNEFNRIKAHGSTDGTLVLIRSKQDITRQNNVWIKDKEESDTTLTSYEEVEELATARLNELKDLSKSGTMNTCALPTLYPGQKITINIPYIVRGNIKVKSFNVTINNDITFSLSLQSKETTFEDIFKERIIENVNITPTNNPNGMTDAIIFNFENLIDYSLFDTQILNDVLSLQSDKSTGSMITKSVVLDNNISQCEIRIKASQFWNCQYYASNNNGLTWEEVTLGSLHNFTSTGNIFLLKVILNESTTGVSPEFDKINTLLKQEV